MEKVDYFCEYIHEGMEFVLRAVEFLFNRVLFVCCTNKRKNIAEILFYIQPQHKREFVNNRITQGKFSVNFFFWFKKIFIINPNLACLLIFENFEPRQFPMNQKILLRELENIWSEKMQNTAARYTVKSLYDLSKKYWNRMGDELIFSLMDRILSMIDKIKNRTEELKNIQIQQIPNELTTVAIKYVICAETTLIKNKILAEFI
jgi:hypothetical protein